MNSFINALWNAKGVEVTGYKNEVGFHGEIVDTRVKYGTDIQVRVRDFDREDAHYLIDGTTLFDGEGGGYRNLHVYF